MIPSARAVPYALAALSAFLLSSANATSAPTTGSNAQSAASVPAISAEHGALFQDVGSYPSSLFDVRATAPADTWWSPDYPSDPANGDLVVIVGPQQTVDPATHWEVKMYWRIARHGTFQSNFAGGVETRYWTWKQRVRRGNLIDIASHSEFTSGWMAPLGGDPLSDKFITSYRSDEPEYLLAANDAEKEMIWDDVLVPGTKIEYYFASNFVNTPNDLYYYPEDVAGGHYFEFEVLPGVRTANVPGCGGVGFNFCAFHPATLYIDMFEGDPSSDTSQALIENSLAVAIEGASPCLEPDVLDCKLPAHPHWDRYDYASSRSPSGSPFARRPDAGSNNGMTLNQMLGYRAVLVNTGTYAAGTSKEEDWPLFHQWLTSPLCSANANRQVFVLNGDACGELLNDLPDYGQPFFNDVLGATLYCDAFNGNTVDPDCAPPEEAYCVRLVQVGAVSPNFPTLVDVDAFGNFVLSTGFGFNVYSTNGPGVGNRIYQAEGGGKIMSYEQIIRQEVSPAGNYKTVLDGVGWQHMTERDAGAQWCPEGTNAMILGVSSEIKAALSWGFDVPPATAGNLPQLSNARDLGTCQGTWNFPADAGDETGAIAVNRLFQNEPNPFDSRTLIEFSLASSGPVEIAIYDVNGRRIKTLTNGRVDAGLHTVTWDGTNDNGERVGSGMYWSQLKTPSFTSNKKLVVIK